jgi:hypothetical protein
VSLAQLRRALLPLCRGWGWAEEAITDLWLLGCPLPQCGPRTMELRLLLPGQFRKWWFEVQQRMAYEASAEVVYEQALR